MEIQFVLNDKQVKAEVGADTILLKRGCAVRRIFGR